MINTDEAAKHMPGYFNSKRITILCKCVSNEVLQCYSVKDFLGIIRRNLSDDSSEVFDMTKK